MVIKINGELKTEQEFREMSFLERGTNILKSFFGTNVSFEVVESSEDTIIGYLKSEDE